MAKNVERGDEKGEMDANIDFSALPALSLERGGCANMSLAYRKAEFGVSLEGTALF